MFEKLIKRLAEKYISKAAGRELGYKDETNSSNIGFKSSYSFKCLLVDVD